MEIWPFFIEKIHVTFGMDDEWNQTLTWSEFSKMDIRVGTVLTAEFLENARKPAIKMLVDFGDLGQRKTSAQITELYAPDEMIGKQVLAVVNFPPKQIGNFMSECLVLGAVGDSNIVTLIQPERVVKNGTRIS